MERSRRLSAERPNSRSPPLQCDDAVGERSLLPVGTLSAALERVQDHNLPRLLVEVERLECFLGRRKLGGGIWVERLRGECCVADDEEHTAGSDGCGGRAKGDVSWWSDGRVEELGGDEVEGAGRVCPSSRGRRPPVRRPGPDRSRHRPLVPGFDVALQ